jgi:hypothetical protein
MVSKSVCAFLTVIAGLAMSIPAAGQEPPNGSAAFLELIDDLVAKPPIDLATTQGILGQKLNLVARSEYSVVYEGKALQVGGFGSTASTIWPLLGFAHHAQGFLLRSSRVASPWLAWRSVWEFCNIHRIPFLITLIRSSASFVGNPGVSCGSCS